MRRNRRIYKVVNHQQRYKWVTREIAALDFLMNIPMAKETQLLDSVQPFSNRQKTREPDIKDSDEQDDLENEVLDAPSPQVIHAGDFKSPVPGRRLRGTDPFHVRFPPSHRYKLLRTQDRSAEIRQWEKQVILHTVQGQNISDGRIFCSSNKAYPVAVLSVIKYKPQEEQAKLQRGKILDGQTSKIFDTPSRDWRGTSYSSLLSGDSTSGREEYMPGFLDDPKLIQSKHNRLVCQKNGTVVGPIIYSIILYEKPETIKTELNEKFHERHPSLPPSLTLSKIRAIKRQAMQMCLRCGIEIGTLALCFVYFERLCLDRMVSKANRRLCMAACYVLAFKFNEPLISKKEKLQQLLDFIDRDWFISSRQVFQAEFGVFVKLGFCLHEKVEAVSHHFVILMRMLKRHPLDYFGEAMFQQYTNVLLRENPQAQTLPVFLELDREHEPEEIWSEGYGDNIEEEAREIHEESLLSDAQKSIFSMARRRPEQWRKAFNKFMKKIQK